MADYRDVLCVCGHTLYEHNVSHEYVNDTYCCVVKCNCKEFEEVDE